jgi:hypothetical protein
MFSTTTVNLSIDAAKLPTIYHYVPPYRIWGPPTTRAHGGMDPYYCEVVYGYGDIVYKIKNLLFSCIKVAYWWCEIAYNYGKIVYNIEKLFRYAP